MGESFKVNFLLVELLTTFALKVFKFLEEANAHALNFTVYHWDEGDTLYPDSD